MTTSVVLHHSHMQWIVRIVHFMFSEFHVQCTGVLHLAIGCYWLVFMKSPYSYHRIKFIAWGSNARQTLPGVRARHSYETITQNKIPSKFITHENFQLSCCSEICEILYTWKFYVYGSYKLTLQYLKTRHCKYYTLCIIIYSILDSITVLYRNLPEISSVWKSRKVSI